MRVRRAIPAAIDRKAVIDAARPTASACPIGSHYVPGAPGFVDTTGINPYDLAKAKRLLGRGRREDAAPARPDAAAAAPTRARAAR